MIVRWICNACRVLNAAAAVRGLMSSARSRNWSPISWPPHTTTGLMSHAHQKVTSQMRRRRQRHRNGIWAVFSWGGRANWNMRQKIRDIHCAPHSPGARWTSGWWISLAQSRRSCPRMSEWSNPACSLFIHTWTFASHGTCSHSSFYYSMSYLCPYSWRFHHSNSSQTKKLKSKQMRTWRFTLGK